MLGPKFIAKLKWNTNFKERFDFDQFANSRQIVSENSLLIHLIFFFFGGAGLSSLLCDFFPNAGILVMVELQIKFIFSFV